MTNENQQAPTRRGLRRRRRSALLTLLLTMGLALTAGPVSAAPVASGLQPVKTSYQNPLAPDDTVSDASNNEIPPVLNTGEGEHFNPMPLKESDSTGTHRLEVVRKHGLWTVNGQTWEDVIKSDHMMTVADCEQDQVEIWELKNPSGGWFHPLHIHLIDAQILDRNGKPPFPYEKGPKDVFYLGENETVRVLMRFGPQNGRYMVHCHNLVHEDHDMMVQFNVGKTFTNRRDDPNDPILADQAKPISQMTPL